MPSSLLGSGIPKLSCLAIHLFSKYQLSDPGPALGNSGFPPESAEGATRPRKVPGEVCGSGTRKPNSICLPWNIQFHPLLTFRAYEQELPSFALSVLASCTYAHSPVLHQTVAFPRIGTSTYGSAPTVPCSKQPCVPTASFPMVKASSFVKRRHAQLH